MKKLGVGKKERVCECPTRISRDTRRDTEMQRFDIGKKETIAEQIFNQSRER
jgi:hypothetical protein